MSEQSAEELVFYILILLVLASISSELLWPRRKDAAGLGYRWANNIGLVMAGQLFLAFIYPLVSLVTAWFVHNYYSGLFSGDDTPWLLAFAVTFLAFDGAAYALHWLSHQVPWLWRLHLVHHSDTSVDFTTTYRHHPGELLVSTVATLPIILVLAPPVTVIFVYQVIRMTINIAQHSNVYIPSWLENILCKFVITPDFHRLHHCSEKQHTNSNYGVVLPWFDYLFGTASYKPFKEQETMELGLEYYREPADNRLDQLLLIPFRRKP